MKVCFLTSEYATRSPTGGMANYVRDSAQALANMDHRVYVICVNANGHVETEEDNGVNVVFVPPYRLPVRRLFRLIAQVPGLSRFKDVRCGWGLVEASLGVWRKAWQLTREQGPFDLYHAPDFGGLAFWELLRPGRQTPMILRGHGFLDLEKAHVKWCGAGFHHSLERFCLRRADYILANSRFLQECYLERFELDPKRVGHLATGFRDTRDEGVRCSLRQQRGWQETTPVIIYVGRIEHQKGCDLLFDALTQCRQSCTDLQAVLIGSVDKAFRSELDCFLAQTTPWVSYLGPISSEEVARWLDAVDLLVLPSRAETFGRVIIEANLHGLPVVATKIDALVDTVEDGVSGILVPPNDPRALVDAIVRLCDSPMERANMGRQARQRALEYFSFSRIISKQVAVYEAVAAGRSPYDLLTMD